VVEALLLFFTKPPPAQLLDKTSRAYQIKLEQPVVSSTAEAECSSQTHAIVSIGHQNTPLCLYRTYELRTSCVEFCFANRVLKRLCKVQLLRLSQLFIFRIQMVCKCSLYSPP
jgi:hypothetical protein